jgi:hypothetical protein
VHDHVAGLLAYLAGPLEEPQGQLLAGVGDPHRDAVVEDRLPLPFQRYPAEPCDQRLPAFAFDGDFVARAQQGLGKVLEFVV